MKRKILYTSVLFALSFSAATLSFSLEKEVSAKADSLLQANLLSPSSYEEHLPLAMPNDISITNDFTAIADGEKIYVYDKTNEEYHAYEHDTKISMLQLSMDRVYFLDEMADLYSLSLEEISNESSAQSMNFSCVNFAINGDYFYCRKGENIFKHPLNEIGKSGEAIVTNLSLTEYTPLAFWKEELCYFQSGELYRVNHEKSIASFPYQISSMTITGNLLALTSNGNLYAYNVNELNALGNAEEAQLLLHKQEGYTAVSANETELYTINGTSIWSFLIEEDFAAYKEICQSSPSINRLNEAKALTLAGGKLFTADNGNGRITVYDVATEKYLQPIQTSVQPDFLASHGKTLLLSSANQAVLYSIEGKTYGESVYSLDKLNGSVVGVTAVYDKYYLLTNTNHCYVFSFFEENWSVTEHIRKTAVGTLLTSDVYGYLYIATDSGVYRYTETSFLDSNGVGEQILSSLPATTIEEIAVDYDRNLYLLSKEILYKYKAEEETSESFSLQTSLVYGRSSKAISFTLGADNNTAYLLFEGDYLAQTNSLNLPAMSTLPTEDSYTQLHAEQNGLQLVETAQGSVLIEFSLNDFSKESEFFPYVGFNRFVKEQKAICLAKTDKYAVLTIFGEDTGKGYLALLEDVTPLAEEEYLQIYTETKTGYLSSNVPLFKYPTLQSNLPNYLTIEKDTAIVIMGALVLEKTYYQISFTEQSESIIGYIPASFVSLFDGTPPESEERIYGEQTEENDSVWRLLYILLGLGMIGILIDFLLLRSRKEDKDEK